VRLRSSITIRQANASDHPALLDLWVASWSATYPEINFDARRQWFLAHLAALANSGSLTLVAITGLNAPAGFVLFDPSSGWLDQLAVGPDGFGTGIARQLLDAAKRLTRGQLALDVNADNKRALAFYAREGFRQTGEGINPNSGAPTIAMAWRCEEPGLPAA
jgi:putative acetyltransferase